MGAASEALSVRVSVMTPPKGVTISCLGEVPDTLHFT
ncbi:hypothetical protein LRR80_05976 [Streptomyces sp. RO-S4]|nr:hypothetical protein [Streptomyces sp. RO-S4]